MKNKLTKAGGSKLDGAGGGQFATTSKLLSRQKKDLIEELEKNLSDFDDVSLKAVIEIIKKT